MPIKVRLTRKFAQRLNGIDLSCVKTGEEIELPVRDAELLIAEGWAALVDKAHDKTPRRAKRARKPARS